MTGNVITNISINQEADRDTQCRHGPLESCNYLN